jgi:hypothetical protein
MLPLYGLKKGLRGRFGMYLPPLLEQLGLAELEHNPRPLTEGSRNGGRRPVTSTGKRVPH